MTVRPVRDNASRDGGPVEVPTKAARGSRRSTIHSLFDVCDFQAVQLAKFRQQAALDHFALIVRRETTDPRPADVDDGRHDLFAPEKIDETFDALPDVHFGYPEPAW